MDAKWSFIDKLLNVQLIDLEQLRFKGMPNHPNNTPEYSYYLHRRHEEGWHEARTPAAGMIVSSDHTGTHIDALCHQSERLSLYGGVPVDMKIQSSTGFSHGAAEDIPPIWARGVLIDVAKYFGVDMVEPDFTIDRSLLQEVAKAQGVEVRQGDVVLVRTGYGAAWDNPVVYDRNGGVASDASVWLGSVGVFAVGADNPAWDDPREVHPEVGSLPAHVLLLVRKGVYIIEHLNLEALSAAGVHEFLFVGLALKYKGATGSPMRPIAVIPRD